MKKFILFFCFILLCVVLIESYFISKNENWFSKPKPTIIQRPLLIYSFPNLKKTIIPVSDITLGPTVSQNETSSSQMFYYSTPLKPNSTEMLKVSGLMNIPKKPGKYPVIIMFRGFVPSNIYKSGIGTQPVANQLAQNGYITLAPDFLGFGDSSPAADESFENRFQTYTTALSLLSSISTLNSALSASYAGNLTADLSKIGIWGHSNGGHIALSILSLSGVKYPTVLWAPVSTSFPYDILYYTDESDDQGKTLRQVLANFEGVYNTDLFSPPNYYSWIKAPIDIEQGTADVEVPYWWSDNLVAMLKKNNLDVTYNQHLGADHNMLPTTTWNSAVLDTINFYNSQFSK